MGLYSGDTYIVIFFIYGLAFFTMGICALLQSGPKDSNFSLLKHVRYLGYFGIAHAVVEWILMVVIARMYPEHNRYLMVSGTFINAVSFTLLLSFGIRLLEYEGKISYLVNYLPKLIFAIWTAGFLASYTFYDEPSRSWFLTYDVLSRYFIGLPGGIITAVAFYRSSKVISRLNIKDIAIKFKGMAFLFASYAVFAGIFVSRRDFFPANIVNNKLFQSYLGFPVELGRAASAIGITVLFLGVVEIFRWETDQRIALLTEQRAASQERKKLGKELHDGIIQTLFATGLYVESLSDASKDPDTVEGLHNIKSNLNDVIMKVREFIGKVSTKSIEIEDLKIKLVELVQNLEKISGMTIVFSYDISDLALGRLSAEKITQVYYIIQEALTNAIKHSKGSSVEVKISSTLESVIASITDDGIGFDISNVESNGRYGLISMRERAMSAGGNIDIRSNKGTSVSLAIPWEGSESYAKRT